VHDRSLTWEGGGRLDPAESDFLEEDKSGRSPSQTGGGAAKKRIRGTLVRD